MQWMQSRALICSVGVLVSLLGDTHPAGAQLVAPGSTQSAGESGQGTSPAPEQVPQLFLGIGVQSRMLGQVVNSLDVTILLSNSGKTLHGFSHTTGRVVRQSLPTKLEPFTPIIATGIACIVHDNVVYAFAAKSGRWLRVKVDDAPLPEVGFETVRFQVGQKIYLCSSTSTEWQVVDLDAD